jgi:hypothetical protein
VSTTTQSTVGGLLCTQPRPVYEECCSPSSTAEGDTNSDGLKGKSQVRACSRRLQMHSAARHVMSYLERGTIPKNIPNLPTKYQWSRWRNESRKGRQYVCICVCTCVHTHRHAHERDGLFLFHAWEQKEDWQLSYGKPPWHVQTRTDFRYLRVFVYSRGKLRH